MSSGWLVERSTGSAQSFHDRDVPERPGRRAWVHQVLEPALVLGSTQPLEAVDLQAAAAAGVTVVRRRSGGGAVLVEPGGVAWVDVVIGPDDPLWDDDVGRAAHWVGHAWARALRTRQIDGVEVHTRGLVTTPWSRLACFGGLGPGEVSVAGRKTVGLAQRRTRHGARFQCAALARWDPNALLAILRLEPVERPQAAADLAPRAAALPASAEDLVEGFLAALYDAPSTRGG